MEFKLNKIDTEIRQRVNDATKEGKVHTKNDIVISKDKREQKKKDKNDFKHELTKYNKRGKKMTITAFKVDTMEVNAYRDGTHKDSAENEKLAPGMLLDVRK